MLDDVENFPTCLNLPNAVGNVKLGRKDNEFFVDCSPAEHIAKRIPPNNNNNLVSFAHDKNAVAARIRADLAG
jgi:hypothetical protein